MPNPKLKKAFPYQQVLKYNLLDYDYIFDWSENNHKDFSKSDSKENSNLVMRIQKNKEIINYILYKTDFHVLL